MRSNTRSSSVHLVWSRERTPAPLHRILETLGEEYPVAEGKGAGLQLSFTAVADENVCQVSRTGASALICHGRPALAMRAVGALLAGLVPAGRTVREESPFTTFGIMLDCSRNAVMTVAHFQRWLRRLTLLGYNMAMLYTEDTYELPGEPFFGHQRGRYTRDELKAIDDYADRLGIEMIGCIQTLGHLEQVLKWPVYGGIRDAGGVLLTGEEKTYALIDRMLRFYGEVFRSRRIHIGMDEAFDLGRGQYLNRHGWQREFDIFNRHLAEVVKACNRHALHPMIWSDMYFRMGSKTMDYYDKECRVPPDVAAMIPKQAQVVYWDYYHDDPDFYTDWIRRHRDLGFEPIMGSGVWTWGLFWHAREVTERNGGACVDACRNAGLKEIFFTMWGDDGGYCDFDSALAGLAFVAEKAYGAGEPTTAVLAKRFAAICGSSYRAQTLAGDLQGANSKPIHLAAVLWDDPLLALFLAPLVVRERGTLRKARRHLARLAQQLRPYDADRGAGNLHHARLLAETIAFKLELTEEVLTAYAKGDHKRLAAARRRIPVMTRRLRALAESFRTVWLANNKPFGLEVMQIRLAGLLARYVELGRRLQAYASGELESIPELDASREPPEGQVPCWNYRQLATSTLNF